MELEIVPEPSEEERRAILDAIAEEKPASAWWESGLDDLRNGALPEQSGGDPGVVEP